MRNVNIHTFTFIISHYLHVMYRGWLSITVAAVYKTRNIKITEQCGEAMMAKAKSGKSWVQWANLHAKNSTSVEDLDPSFKSSIKIFIKALEDAGATVTVSTTKRSAKRAYLFHWSWMISQGKCKAKDVSPMAGVDIDWDHGDDTKSKNAALEMVKGFHLAVPPNSINPPSLSSNHIAGKAIDMTIEWKDKIKVKKQDGKEVEVTYMENVNSNVDLHAVGASYGVKKLITDAPHWSFNGR